MLQKPIGTIQWIYNTSIKKLRIALYAMAAFVTMLGTGFISRMIHVFDMTYIEIPEMEMETPAEIPIAPRVDAWLITLGICFVLSIIILIVFFKKSDKLPTKRKADRI